MTPELTNELNDLKMRAARIHRDARNVVERHGFKVGAIIENSRGEVRKISNIRVNLDHASEYGIHVVAYGFQKIAGGTKWGSRPLCLFNILKNWTPCDDQS